jgi:hypothetical protein
MRKIVLTILLISVALLVVACNKGQTNAANNGANVTENGQSAATNTGNNGKNQNGTYEIIKKTDTLKNIEANYPQLSGLSDTTKQAKINEMIKKEALSICDSSNADEVHAKCDYKIKWQSAGLLSIVFTGYCQYDGTPHPNAIFVPFNVDLNTGKEIELKDIVNLDENFVKKVKAGEFKGASLEVKSTDLPELTNSKMLAEISRTGYFYFTKDSLGINVTAPHPLGDNAQFEVKYKDITNNIKAENGVWKELSK